MRGRLLLGAITAVMLMAVALSGGGSPAVGQFLMPRAEC